MTVKKSVFASISERQNYYKLSRQWGDKYRIYHNLPFLNVFQWDNLIDHAVGHKIELTEIEKNRLKKTSIDFILCDESDTPLVCIDFDGLYQGFNVGPQYYPTESLINGWRKEIMDLKLKVAFASDFPYFIVSSNQFGDITLDIRLTIVDGIIGEVLASRAIEQRAKSFNPQELNLSQEDFDSLPQSEQYDLIQDWVIDTEVIEKFNHSPLYNKAEKLAYSQTRGGDRFSTELLWWPDSGAYDSLQRAKELKKAQFVGTRLIINTRDVGPVENIVMLPNFNAPHYGVGLDVSKSIAKIIGYSHLQALRRIFDQ